jgi:8-oxo-dGTP diphosphatase
MNIIFYLRVRALIIDNDSVLLTNSGKKYTFLPGGHVELGESIPLALQRELKEELGVDSQITKYLGSVEHAWDVNEVRHIEVNHIFEVKCPELNKDSDPKSLEEHLHFKWVNVKDLNKVNFEPTPLIKLIEKYMNGDQSTWWATTI